MELTVGSLFTGIGGIDLAFEQAGFKVLWGVEKDAACCRTFRHNFKGKQLIENDIRIVNPDLLAAVDVITAGFPCQPFSVAGKQHGFNDPRGHLFYEVAKFIRAYLPRFVFLENVPNLMNHNCGKTFLVVHNVLSELNYSIRYRVMRASKYGGTPQIRDRIYIVAFREQEDCDVFRFSDKIDLSVTIEDVLQRHQKKHDIYYYSGNDLFFEKASKIVTKHDSIYRVYHDSIKVTQNHMCPTLTAAMGGMPNQVPIVADDFGLRKLTIRECLDFQGFPRSFYFPSTISIDDAYKQCGNSVVVPVIKRIAEKIKEVL